MNNSNIFNQYFYEILDDMEDLARDSYSEPEDENEKNVLDFCKKFKEAINQIGMDIRYIIYGINDKKEPVLDIRSLQ